MLCRFYTVLCHTLLNVMRRLMLFGNKFVIYVIATLIVSTIIVISCVMGLLHAYLVSVHYPLSPQFVCYVTSKFVSVSLIVCRRYHTICQHYHGVCHYDTQDAHECWSAVINALAHSLPVQDDPQVCALYRE